MRTCLLTLSAECAALTTPPLAQSALPQGNAAATTPARVAVVASKAAPVVTAASTDARTPARTAGTTIIAAGSVIVPSDANVANASIVQIRPPAPGFVCAR